MTVISTTLLVITATLTALVAGLMYAYACSVNPGLGKLGDAAYLAAMQSINKEIQNPWFFLGFMGALVLLPVSTWISYHAGQGNTTWILLGATVLYVVGVFGVTMFGNVPLNNALAAFNLSQASAEQLAQQRALFEARWNGYHTVRTAASIISLVLVLVACIGNRDA